MRDFTLRWLSRLILLAFLTAWIASAIWHADRRLPPGLHIAGGWENLPANQVHFLRDLSAADASGAPFSEQQIDANLETMISQAREFVVLDAGLFGDLPAAGPRAPHLRVAPAVAAAIADNLLRARQEQPNLQVLLMVDPTSVEMSTNTALIDRLRAAGIHVVVVNVGGLRSANAVFVAFWQLCCGWWSHDQGSGRWPNPVGIGPAGVAMGLWGRTPPYPRSHRQMLVADDGSGGLQGMIFSRSLNAEAALHSASALRISGSVLESALEAEFAVAQFSGWSDGGAMQVRVQRLIEHQRQLSPSEPADDEARSRVVSEQRLGDALVSLISTAGKQDSIDVAALYLSQRELVRSLLDAARRGATIRVLLDPNKDGYGFDRSGLPNRVVGSELVADSDGAVRVRWYRTHGEQFSPGFVLMRQATHAWLVVGTSEMSRQDLNDFNLAAGIVTELPLQAQASTDALTWFDTLWLNRASGGIEYSSDADVYADASQVRYWQYRLMEASGTAFE